MNIKKINEVEESLIEDIIKNQKKDIYNKEKKTQAILEEVKEKGDEALIKFTKKFDKVELDIKDLKVKDQEIEEAYEKIKEKHLSALKKAAENIESFHSNYLPNSLEVEDYGEGKKLGYKYTPIENVGCYVPGGKASYPSSVLMNALPAKLAGVEDIIITTPPQENGEINPYTLVTADMIGIRDTYKAGGAQAIGAMAYGTNTIDKRKKIVGPGGTYVAAAKNLVKKRTEVDMVAGPSEIAIVADDSADIDSITWDLFAQAEHGPDSLSLLFTNKKEIAKKVQTKVNEKLNEMKRVGYIKNTFDRSIIFLGQKKDLFELINDLAPEHLEINTKKPSKDMKKIKNAGAIFLGNYSPVAAGDYATGCNHVLPTAGSAKVMSGLGVEDFIKKSSVQYLTKEGLNKIRDTAKKIAEIEGMEAHKKSIENRFKEE